MTRVGCGVLGGTGVCHLVIHGHGGNERHRAEGTGKGLWAPLPEPRCQRWQLLWQSSRERQGARGGVNKCPVCCTGESYQGAAKKVCGTDQSHPKA
jgi:hypothetical protein